MSRRLRVRSRGVAAGAALALALVQLSQAAAQPEFDHRALARQALEGHIRPGYARLAAAAADFARRTEHLCTAPAKSSPAGVPAAFGALVRAWGRIEHIRFGPVGDAYAHERLAFWPDPKGIGTKQVRAILKTRDPAALAPATLAVKSVAVQGLTALEIVLFAENGDPVVQSGEEGSFHCLYALAIARNIEAIATALYDAWSENGSYAALWLNPGPDNPVYLSGMDVTRDLARALLDGLASLRDDRIAGPIGLRPGGAPPTRAAFARGGLAVAVIEANAGAYLDLFVAGGFADAFRARSPGAVATIVGELTRARDLATAIEAGGGRDVRAPDVEEQLLLLGFPLKNARARAAELIANVAGLVLKFNDSDGN